MRPNNCTLLLIIFVGFCLRLYNLGAQSLWYDETVSAYLASLPPLELIAHTARDIHPPGYYLLLHSWTRLVGHTEFALAYFSLIFGLLTIPLSYLLGKRLFNRSVALWTAALMTCSPFGIWYAQEVRMYTLGAALGLLVVYCLVRGTHFEQISVQLRNPISQRNRVSRNRHWLGYWLSATLGLYSLYYFAFLLIPVNMFFGGYLLALKVFKTFRVYIITNLLIVVSYIPWLPTFWRQATNPPVPPWRNFDLSDLPQIVLEIWTVLSLGQSVQTVTVWPILLLMLVLFALGVWQLSRQVPTNLFLLLTYLIAPIGLILGLSFITPLYHVRYIFIYSPPFYMLVALGIALFSAKRVLHPYFNTLLFLPIFLTSLYSIQQLHTNPLYQADDYRAAVQYIENQWQPGDILISNAGYTYPAVLYYADLPFQRNRLVPYQLPPTNEPMLVQTGTVNGSEQLGWGDPRADFYPMSEAETQTALTQMSEQFPRWWILRVYDTVTDPDGTIRAWLDEHAILVEDQPFAGESYLRVQSFTFSNTPPKLNPTATFADHVTLLDWHLPSGKWQAGQSVPLKLWWQVDERPTADYKFSLKLWHPSGTLAAQGKDGWSVGTFYRMSQWQPNEPVYQATELVLPADIAPGTYWLNVELYHPETGQPLPRLDGADPVVTLGPIEVVGKW
ncbi:glycosyltransferase family 39 protein [Anaerolineales bacterium HSG6]|nr:glycosyltransferase family 39 protein [Anaerolineales bacterium HSG6]